MGRWGRFVNAAGRGWPLKNAPVNKGESVMERIKDNIFVETHFLGCNPAFVVTGAGIVLIDTPQKPGDAFHWKKEIEKHGEVAFIINTDHHQDHAIGNYYFEGDIIMHEGTRERLLEDGMMERSKNWVTLMEPNSGFLMDHYFIRLPKITYRDKMTLYLGGEIFELIHITSHTRDETLVYMPQKGVLFTGDTLCTNGLPGLNESYPQEWLNALKFMEELDFELLVPGHGDMGNKDSVKAFREELSNLYGRVIEQIKKGVSREQIITQTRYPDTVHARYPSEFSNTFRRLMENSIGRLYDEWTKANT
jgi:glyoxylase-like metal-dependent hydrolase (beta-lactamase superfamily II)